MHIIVNQCGLSLANKPIKCTLNNEMILYGYNEIYLDKKWKMLVISLSSTLKRKVKCSFKLYLFLFKNALPIKYNMLFFKMIFICKMIFVHVKKNVKYNSHLVFSLSDPINYVFEKHRFLFAFRCTLIDVWKEKTAVLF